MISKRKIIIAAALAVITPVGALLAADRVGIDIGLIVDRFVDPVMARLGSEDEEPDPTGPSGKTEARLQQALSGKGHAGIFSDEPYRGENGELDPEMKKAGIPEDEKDEADQAKEEEEEPDSAAEEHAQKPFDPAFHELPHGEAQPWRIYRDLQRAQDAMVRGNPGAMAAYREALGEASRQMLELPVEAWRHERNLMSAAAFVMSGGNPEIAQKLLSERDRLVGDLHLLEAAHAFSRGRYYQAYNLLYGVDPRQLPLSIAGQVSLIRAMLASPRNLEQAAEFLTLARMLAPGTLTEEAAIRRQIRVFTETEDVDAFFRESESYMRRFPKSVFLADFLRNYATGVLRLYEGAGSRTIDRILHAEEMIDNDASLYLLTLLARGATVFGQTDLARLASERSLHLANPGTRLAERLRLYRAAASLNQASDLPETIAELDAIDADLLGSEDKRLLAAARLVGEQIRMPLQTSYPAADHEFDMGMETESAGTEADTKPADPLPEVLVRARNILEQAELATEW